MANTRGRSKFAEVVGKDAVCKEPDELKKRARVAFNFPAKGRGEEHLAIARQYLTERVSIAWNALFAPCRVTIYYPVFQCCTKLHYY